MGLEQRLPFGTACLVLRPAHHSHSSLHSTEFSGAQENQQSKESKDDKGSGEEGGEVMEFRPWGW